MSFWKEHFEPYDPVASTLKQARRVTESQRDRKYNYGCLYAYNSYVDKWDEMSNKQKSIILTMFHRYNIPWC